MPGTSDTFTSSNRLDKQPTGGNYNLWGEYLNTNFDLIDDMKDGNVIISLSTAQHTLSVNDAATDEARMASITVIGTPGGTATMTAPNVEKLTWVENIVTGGWPIVWTNGTGTSCTIPNGASCQVQCDFAGNMKILGGSVFGSRVLQKIGQGTATDDAVRMDQIGLAARGVPTFGSTGQVLRNQGTLTATISGTATATTTYGWEDQGKSTIYIPASAFKVLSSTGFGTASSLMCTTSSQVVDAVVFGSASSQYANFSIRGMPKSWDGQTMTFKAHAFTTGSTGTGVFEMSVGLAQVNPGATLDQAYNYVNGMLGTEASTATFDLVTGTGTASVSGGTASQGATISVSVRRRIGGSDTMSGNLFFTGLTAVYNNNLPNDN
ncbi:MAG TPA: hypothetical protein VIS06_06405 [Mycobacteriales bacterium]